MEYFAGRFAKGTGKSIRHIAKHTLERLQAYSWPGNIRELQNVVERAVILTETNTFVVDESWLRLEPVESERPYEGLSALADREVEMIEAALSRKPWAGVRTLRRSREVWDSPSDARVEDQAARH